MKNYVTLLRLEMKKNGANAAALRLFEAESERRQDVKDLQAEKQTIEQSHVWARGENAERRDTALARLDRKIELAIVARDVAAEEHAIATEAWKAALGTYQNVLNHLKANPNLLPEGASHGL